MQPGSEMVKGLAALAFFGDSLMCLTQIGFEWQEIMVVVERLPLHRLLQ